MASANVDGMVREGVKALQSGRKEEARALLLRAVDLDQYNEEAWLWLSGVLESFDDQRTCLENVLSINPGNASARQGLDYLNQHHPASDGSASAFGGSSSGLATSVEWGAPDEPAPSSSSPPSVRIMAQGEVSPDILDDWVTNLNLPAGSVAPVGTPNKAAAASIASPFGNIDFDEDDIFASGPFKADQATSVTAVPVGPSEGQQRRRAQRAEAAARPAATTMDDEVDLPPEFRDIPAEITATRLPGTIERTPAAITALVVLLALVNVGVAVIFFLQIFA